MEADEAEVRRIHELFRYERELWKQNVSVVAGLDEAGRGPLAGPVVAAAVVFTKETYIPQVNDSKKLTPPVREELYEIILEKAADCSVGFADVAEIDRYNIVQASFVAMRRAVEGLSRRPDFLLVDGKTFPEQAIPCRTIVQGDARSFSIAAASILAKVTRDRMMLEYDKLFPQYGFAAHKGYATRAHLDAIEQHGLCPIHRRSFHPRRFRHQLSLFQECPNETEKN